MLHVGDEGVVLKPGDSFHIPKGIKHAFVSGTAGARGIAVASPTSFTW
jgi:quercetin dioxygenase-like cupin family protein